MAKKQKDITLLKGSIKKWKMIAFEGKEDLGVINCPLCGEYWDDDCSNCLIRQYTGKQLCLGTPYEMFGIYHSLRCNRRYTPHPRVIDNRSRRIAIDEIIFLYDLLEIVENSNE